MSDEGGVTPSDEVLDISPLAGNTRGGQRGSGHLAVPGLAQTLSWDN